MVTSRDFSVNLFTVDQLQVWCDQHPDAVQAFEKIRSLETQTRYRLKSWYNRPEQVKLICLILHKNQHIISTAQVLYEYFDSLWIVSVESVWTQPNYRKRGYGKQCLRTLLQKAVELHPVDVFVLSVDSLDHKYLINLYKSLGFTKLCKWPKQRCYVYHLDISPVSTKADRDHRKKAIIKLLTET